MLLLLMQVATAKAFSLSLSLSPLRVNIGLRRASRAAQQPLVFSLSLGAVSAINLSGVRSGKELKTAVDD